MKQPPDFITQAHDPRDPNPWLAMYLDHSTPIDDAVKRAWLADSSSRSRQFVLPFVRPLARTMIVLIQVIKVFLPRKLAFSRAMHRMLAWGMENFISSSPRNRARLMARASSRCFFAETAVMRLGTILPRSDT